MSVYCHYCADPYEPVEYRPVFDEDEPHFCSDECESEYHGEVDFTLNYSF